MRKMVFLYKKINNDDRDCCAYIENKHLDLNATTILVV